MTYTYCQRAWWYQKLGVPFENRGEIAEGSEFHYLHGLATMQIGYLRYSAFTLILLGIILLVIYYIPQFLLSS